MILMAALVIPIWAQTEANFNVTLTEDGQGVVITGYTGTVLAVRIPATIQGMPVREIGREAFQGSFGMTVALWLAQDLLTVLMSGTVRMPEFFLLCLVYRLLIGERDVYVPVIWTAFFGGLLWDLRWVGIPFFTLCYVVVAMAVMSVWNTLPASGRTLFVIFFIFWAAQLLPAVLYVLILERATGNLNWTLFAVQQGCAAPVSLLGAYFYFKHEKNQNA